MGSKSKLPLTKPKGLKETSPSLPEYAAPTRGLLSTLPSSWVPYAELIRLDKPHGIWMIFFPHIVGLTYASVIAPSPIPASTMLNRAGRLLIWTILIRSAGCAWNDNIDQDYDRKTARCRNRPIARGAISTTKGHVYTALIVLLAFLSVRDLPFECTIVGLVFSGLTAIYPFGKRFTNFPQVILGSTLASAVPLASYSANVNALSDSYRAPTLCLVATIVLMVVFYDVVYARQDTADDVKSGVKGMAVLFRNHLKLLLCVVACGIAGLLYAVGNLVEMGPQYFMLSVAGTFLGLLSMIVIIHMDILSSWVGCSGWCYALAVANLLGGFLSEYYAISMMRK